IKVALRKSSQGEVAVLVADKGCYPVSLFDSLDGWQSIQGVKLVAGYYQLIAQGNIITFQNIQDSGTPVHVQLTTSYLQPGSVWLGVNEWTTEYDDITVQALD
ncbi:MAG: hypothetical protein WC508_03355, partial [Patescibacteria group bacterium]